MLLQDQKAAIAERAQSIPVKVIALAHDLGLRVYTSGTLEDQTSGLIKKDKEKGGESGYAIFVNAHHSEVRQRFTIAHEIAHFILHKSLIGDGIVEDALFRAEGFANEIERQANAMAADILMPQEAIIEVQREGLIDIHVLAQRFNVSKEAMSIRVLGVSYRSDH